MGRRARHVHTDPAEIARIENLAARLPGGARVRIRSTSGDIVSGVVAELPIVQLFVDDGGREGVNAVVRLEDPDVPTFDEYVWLDEIESVEALDTSPPI